MEQSQSSSPNLPSRVDLAQIKADMVATIKQDAEIAGLPAGQQRNTAMAKRFMQLYSESGLQLPRDAVEKLFREVAAECVATSGSQSPTFGRLQPLLDDPTISEVMVNGPNQVYVERKGKLMRCDLSFRDDSELMEIVEKIVKPLGRRIDRKHPMVDARLPDGSRVNVIIPPAAIDGTTITIRKFSKDRLQIDDLISFGTLTEPMANFLRSCVIARLNIVISGGTGSGKTTLLNIMSGFIPPDERIVTIEDSAELQLHQEHVVRLETVPDISGDAAPVTIRDLVKNSLRMRPERIVVGECRSGETLDMLQAMNTGHDGSLTTLHANSPRDALARIETMCLMSGMELPVRVIREQIASAVDLIVQQSRLRDGSRKVIQITEVSGMEGDTITLSDIFKYEQTGLDGNGKVIGEFKSGGVRPMFTPRLEAAGIKVTPELFGMSVEQILQSGRTGRGR